MEQKITFKGRCKGVELIKRGINDNHICINILTEDDGNWFVSKSEIGFSSSWIDELIEQLQTLKNILRHKNQICMKDDSTDTNSNQKNNEKEKKQRQSKEKTRRATTIII